MEFIKKLMFWKKTEITFSFKKNSKGYVLIMQRADEEAPTEYKVKDLVKEGVTYIHYV